jgi:hypothetical protein
MAAFLPGFAGRRLRIGAASLTVYYCISLKPKASLGRAVGAASGALFGLQRRLLRRVAPAQDFCAVRFL